MKNTIIIANDGSQYPVAHCTFYADCIEAYCEWSGRSIIPNSEWKYVEVDVVVDSMTMAEREIQNDIDYTRNSEHNKKLNIEFQALHGKRPRIQTGWDQQENDVAQSVIDNVNDAVDILSRGEEIDESIVLPSWFNVENVKEQIATRQDWLDKWYEYREANPLI